MKLDNTRKEYILNLLKEAKKADSYFKQFGSSRHKYKLNPVISAESVLKAERKYNFKLPEDYFWFITNVGNGGAGPYYGLKSFSLDKEKYLKLLGKETMLSPMRSKEEYDQFICKYEECEEDEYDELNEELWQGLLYLGTQGCTMNIHLILSGEYRGKIIYGDYDRYRPFFPSTNNFLEWYENWLLETSKGYDMTWYGSKLLGDEESLISKYLKDREDSEVKISILHSMFKFKEMTIKSLDILYKNYFITNNENEKEQLFKLLLNFNYSKINTIIIEGFNSDNPDKYVDYICMYQENNFDYWYKILLENIEKFSERCIDSLFWRIFQQCRNVEVNDMLKLLENDNVNIRKAALGNLFRFCDTNFYIDKILPMFNDEKEVVLSAVYMTWESNDRRLIPIYKRLLTDYKKEDNDKNNFAINYIEKFLKKVSGK